MSFKKSSLNTDYAFNGNSDLSIHPKIASLDYEIE